MKKVTGIGGVFFKSKDANASRDWYAKHLGIESGEYGAMFEWLPKENPEQVATTSWNPFSAKSDYFGNPDQQFMVNYRVDDLAALLAELKKAGVEIVGEMQEFEYGKFAWVLDADGNRVELWEPVDAPLIEAEENK